MIFMIRLPGLGWVELKQCGFHHFVYRSPFGWRDCTNAEDEIIEGG